MLMPVVQVAVRRLRLQGAPLDEIGAGLNDTVGGLSAAPRLVSLVYLQFDRRTGDIEYVNMGHPPPVLVTGGSRPTVRWLDVGGPVAGAIESARYEIGRERLDAGDTLLLYTDGASEAENDQAEPFAEGRLAAVVSENREQPPDRVIAAVCGAVDAFCADPLSRDDMTLLVIRRRQAG